MLNVVNFGAGSYVLYAEMQADGQIEVDPEPYGDTFARPARLLPVEAKALMAAIDLIGEHIPEGSLASVREKIVAALGEDPAREGLQVATAGGDDAEIARVVSRAIAGRRLLAIEYYKENEDEFSAAHGRALRADQRPRGLVRRLLRPRKDGVATSASTASSAPTASDERFEPRPEVDPAADVDGWPRTGEVPASRRARVWISPERARWAREERTVVAELRRRRGDRRARLRRRRLARARGAQGGRRRGRARARRDARARRVRAAARAAARCVRAP